MSAAIYKESEKDIEAEEKVPLIQDQTQVQNPNTPNSVAQSSPLNPTSDSYRRDGDYYLGVTLGFIFGIFSFIFYICKGEKGFRWGICIGLTLHVALNILGMLFYLLGNRSS